MEQYQKYVNAQANDIPTGPDLNNQEGGLLPDSNYPANFTTENLSSSRRHSTLNMNNMVDLNEFMKRFEDKIMDRIKIQMDALYQKIEDRVMQ